MRFSLRSSLWLISLAAASLLIISQWVASRQWEQRAKRNQDLIRTCRIESMVLQQFDTTPRWNGFGDQPQSLETRLQQSQQLYAQFLEFQQNQLPPPPQESFSVQLAINWDGRDFALRSWRVNVPPHESRFLVCRLQEDGQSPFSSAQASNAFSQPVVHHQLRERMTTGEHWIRLTHTKGVLRVTWDDRLIHQENTADQSRRTITIANAPGDRQPESEETQGRYDLFKVSEVGPWNALECLAWIETADSSFDRRTDE